MTIIPKHIAIIMDGNGRWAERKLLPRVAGYHKGVESARVITQRCIDLKIPILTLFAFSSENWQRPAAEVGVLMGLLQKLLVEEIHELHANNVKLQVIGDIERLSTPMQTAIKTAHSTTNNNTGLKLNIALNYGGRWDILQAVKLVAKSVSRGDIKLEELDEQLFGKYLSLDNLPDPDLLIRTSGEQRISNFLLWQLAYTEIYFTKTLWPDFGVKELDLALASFAQRERRFGLVAEHA